jgi:outer membrane protein
MMRSLYRGSVAALVLGSLLLVPALSFAQGDTKVAFVDTRRALANCKEGKTVQDKLKAMLEKKRAEFGPKRDEVQKLEQEFESQQFVLSEEAREERRVAIAQRKKTLEREFEDAQAEVAIEERKMMKPLIDKVDKELKALGKDKGFTVILEQTAPFVLYSQDALDITDMLIERLNGA